MKDYNYLYKNPLVYNPGYFNSNALLIGTDARDLNFKVIRAKKLGERRDPRLKMYNQMNK